ncbi:hypothetical protein [Alicyclobacillus mengziensis]|uniref:Uncharacterized protein n=1 Tax=Alicyclobacillus mengziensis TaxID=2931921 RepID=A0A9X7W2C1_9BACL|nr:hypothetical protein [Alicyclobacillus mengziensis]QSO49049.1 hypothetical protein JZ786_09040 [Alicyclobacillus mengziensis]
MARLDRFKYLPMLVRAYQEARNRTQAEWNNQPDQMNQVRSVVVSNSGADGKHNSHSTDKHPNTKTRLPQQGPVVSHRKKNVTRQSKKVLRSPARRNVPVVAKKPVKTASPKHTTALGAGIGQNSAALRHVLNELRATKQQLSQLQSIQTQLTRVQLQLDQQLQVLRRSMGTSASGEVRSTDTGPDAGAKHKPDNTVKGQEKEVLERA